MLNWSSPSCSRLSQWKGGPPAGQRTERGKSLLGELDGLSLNDEHWMPKMKVLKEVTEHHLEEEERSVFKQARKAVSEQQAQDIGQAVEDIIR